MVVADAAGLWFQTEITADTFLPQNSAQFNDFWARLSSRPLPGGAILSRDYVREVHQSQWIIRRVLVNFQEHRDLLDGRLQSLQAPVLILWGKQDKLIPLSVGQAAATRSAAVVVADLS